MKHGSDAIREGLELGREYASEALANHDAAYKRHPATEADRREIVEDIAQIDAALSALPSSGQGAEEPRQPLVGLLYDLDLLPEQLLALLRDVEAALVDLHACDDPACTDLNCLHVLARVRKVLHGGLGKRPLDVAELDRLMRTDIAENARKDG